MFPIKPVDVPELLRAAAENTLGLLGLMIVVIAAIALVFFYRAPNKLKLMVFFALLLGAALFTFSLIQILHGPGDTAASWIKWLNGKWCGPEGTSQTWTVEATGDYGIKSKADSEANWQEWTVSYSDRSPDTVTLTSTSPRGGTVVYRRVGVDMFQLDFPLGTNYRTGPFHRCGN